MEVGLEALSYWVIPGRLMAGVYPGAKTALDAEGKLQFLLARGVRTFLDLTEPGETTRFGALRPYEDDLRSAATACAAATVYHRFPIRDLGIPTRGLMVAILDALDAALGGGAPTYVHCLGGRGRTGTVLGCHLVRHAARLLGVAAADHPGRLALRRIEELRRSQGILLPGSSPEMPAQREFVLNWQEGL